jgi:hypothetical protein
MVFMLTTTEEQVSQINNYLIQFKETLEFILQNISVDNLSPELINKLNELGSDIEKSHVEREEEIQQVSGKILSVADVINSPMYQSDIDARVEAKKITVSDVVNSTEFQNEMDSVEETVQQNVESKLPTPSEIVDAMDLRVNYDTGHLEY